MLTTEKNEIPENAERPHEGECPEGFPDGFQPEHLVSRHLEECWITSRQIEAARIAVTRYMKREGQIWIRVFPDKPVTKKPAEVRMGKGKGSPEYFVAVVRPGRILFEAEGVSMEVAKEALRLAAQKLPIKTKFIVRHDYAE